MFWGRTWMIRGLVRIRCCSVFNGVELQRTNCQCRLSDALFARETDLQLPETNYNQWSNCQYRLLDAPCARETDLRPSAGFWPFWKPIWLGFLPVTSSLLPCLARLLARFCALFSAFCRLSSFPLERLGRSSYRWYGIDCKRCCRRLVRVVFVERADELSKVLDRWGWLPGILFLRIPFPRHQVVEAW